MLFGDISGMVLAIPALMIAVILHEVAHGYAAYKMGDPTAKEMGRLTLNPIPHIDPLGTIILPALLMLMGSSIIFGWAKPVPIDPSRFRNLRKGMFIVSIAGIITNFSLAVFFGIFNRVLHELSQFTSPTITELLITPLTIFSTYSVGINLILGLFNAIPIPPLDGSKALMSLVSYKYWELFYRYEMYGFIVITVLLFTGILQQIILPPFTYLYRLILGI